MAKSPIFDHKLRLKKPAESSTVTGPCCSPASSSNERWYGIEEQLSQSTARATFGITALTATGTAALFSDATGAYINYLSGTGLSAVAGWTNANAVGHTIHIQHLPDMLFVMKTGAGATDIANLRIWAGLHSNGSLATDVPGSLGISGLAFRYSTVAGDTTWQATSFDGVGDTVTNTGIAVTANTRYVLRIKVVSTALVEYYINGSLVATLSTTLPAAATNIFFAFLHTVNAVAGTARNIRIRKVYIDAL